MFLSIYSYPFICWMDEFIRHEWSSPYGLCKSLQKRGGDKFLLSPTNSGAIPFMATCLLSWKMSRRACKVPQIALGLSLGMGVDCYTSFKICLVSFPDYLCRFLDLRVCAKGWNKTYCDSTALGTIYWEIAVFKIGTPCCSYASWNDGTVSC